MPSVSAKQHRAMAAAASGHSTLGIPKSVGQEFMHADYNDDHHADAHISNAHPHQEHTQVHHALESHQVAPNRKDYKGVKTAGGTVAVITDGHPIGQYKHHVHDKRDLGDPHHQMPSHPHHRK